jgi:excisionase family DNA binding protein
MKVTRIQVAEKTVNAADEEAAAQKIQAEIDRPYGFLGSWKTEAFEVEILSAESRIAGLTVDSEGGPMVNSVKRAAELLGVSRTVLYELVRSGEIEHVRVGKRILISRAALEKFIETNSRVGYSGL